MTEDVFAELTPPEGGFDPLDPAHASPIVVALCADEAQRITGQVFSIYGGSVNALQSWQLGEQFVSESGWEPEALLAALLDRYRSSHRSMWNCSTPHARRLRAAWSPRHRSERQRS